MQAPQELEYWVALSLIPGLGGEKYRSLLQAFGLPEQVFATGLSSLKQVVSDSIAHEIRLGVDRAKTLSTLAWLENPQNCIVTLSDAEYPRALLEIPDPPPLLYLKGRIELLDRPGIAIVGSRNATPQGEKNAEAFAQTLSNGGLTVVSGMALGIDTAAHKGGLAGAASSIAVVGTGLDIVYPARNRPLAHRLADQGLIVSEFPLGTPAIGSNFPRRNRIISGLSRGCLVVEGALRSGSLITARQAAEQGREVFAIPGSIHSPLAKGCHALIKQGAKLVESAQDILEELGWAAPPAEKAVKAAGTPEEESLLALLGHDPIAIDALVSRSGLTADGVSAMLLHMELAGKIACLPGGLYQRIN